MEETSREKFYKHSSVFLIFLIFFLILGLFFFKSQKIGREWELQWQAAEVLEKQEEILEETRNLLTEISNIITSASRPPRIAADTDNNE